MIKWHGILHNFLRFVELKMNKHLILRRNGAHATSYIIGEVKLVEYNINKGKQLMHNNKKIKKETYPK